LWFYTCRYVLYIKNETISINQGLRKGIMKAKKFMQDNSAVSEVLGVVLIIGILVTAFSIVISINLPQWTKSFEAAHAGEVVDEFSELASQVDSVVLVAKQGGEVAAGTTAITMKPDRVPVIGMSPQGSSLEFRRDKDRFYITPYASTDPTPPPGVAGFWEETTTADFLNHTRKANVDLNFDKIRLSRIDMEGELIIDNTTTTLDGVYLRDNIKITNSTVYLVPGNYLKLYANTIFIDSTSEIIANESGYSGGRGGSLGAGPGFGRYGLNGSGGGGAGYAGYGGAGGLSGFSNESNYNDDAALRGRYYGDNTSSSFVLGSGGGGGACGEGTKAVPHQGTVGGSGGNGGGSVLLNAQQIIVHGAIYADGAAGSAGIGSANYSSGGGGGGSGGTILIQGDDVNLSSATLSANGSAGGAGGSGKGDGGGGGGGGSGGRIKIFYGNTYNNSPLIPHVDSGTGGAGGLQQKKLDGCPGDPGSGGVFNETKTAYISGIYYKDSGFYESRVFNTSSTTTCYYNITWNDNTTDYTSITVKVRTSIYEEMDDVNATMWQNCDAVASGQNLTELNSVFDWHQYIQYRVELSTYDDTMTPVFYGVNITYNTSDTSRGFPVIAESTGMVKFKSGHIYYPKQEIAYEHGAVLKCQRERGEEEGIVIQPPPILINNESGVPTIDISMINLTGSNNSYSGTTATSVENSYVEYDSISTKFHNLSLNISTEYPVIWGNWFNDTLAESGLNESRYEVIETGDYVVVNFYGDEQHVHLVAVDKTEVWVTLAT
jgi:hypothetical protein